MEILNFEEQPQGSYSRAVFDVHIPEWAGIILRRVKLCQSKQGHFYIQPHSYKAGEGYDGKSKWEGVFGFVKPENSRGFNNAVLEALKPLIDSNLQVSSTYKEFSEPF